jgi:RND family efflux transporter MFP subunit
MRHTTIAALSLSAVVLVGCQKEKSEAPPPIRPVKYQVVEPTGGQFKRSFDGESSAGVESKLSFRVNGTIKKVHVKTGDPVKKKQLLAELESTDYELQVSQASAEYTSAKATEAAAASNFKRVEELYVSGDIPPSQFEAAKAEYKTAKARTAAMGNAVSLASQQRRYTKLYSPVDGSVAATPGKDNTNVQGGQLIVALNSGDSLKVKVSVSDKYIGLVDSGDLVVVRFSELEGKQFGASVSEISPTSASAGAEVTVLMDATTEDVRPGMAATVEFEFGEADEPTKIVVPSAAVGQDRQGDFVFVVEKTTDGLGTVKRRKVTPSGEPHADGIPIEEGLAEGELVVIAGRTRIQDGLTVAVPTADGTK